MRASRLHTAFLAAVALTLAALHLQRGCPPLATPTEHARPVAAAAPPPAPAPAAVGVPAPVDGGDCADTPPAASGSGCLQQAMWGKCGSSYMRPGTCDLSCGRCESRARAKALRRVLLVSARQAAPCVAAADPWVMRAMQNKADYARAQGMQGLAWTSALLDASYDGAWNKLAYLQRLMRAALAAPHARGVVDGQGEVQWLLWMDWDVLVTDLQHALPVEEYEAAGTRLVLGGEPEGVFAEADYLKLNSGVMLLRVHNWSLALLERMLRHGGKQARHRHALAAQAVVKNLCVGCIDDQAVLLQLLHDEPSRWRGPTLLERRFLLQGYWEDFATALPSASLGEPASAEPASSRPPPSPSAAEPLRAVRAARLPPLSRAVFGSRRVPLAVHFAGCQLCSGKAAAEHSARCWPSFRRAMRFAEEQSYAPLGLRHAAENRSAPMLDAPLREV